MPSVHGLVDKLLRQYHPAPPPISTAFAVFLLVLYTAVYVFPLYFSPLSRPSPTLSRDAPSVIRARITSVIFSCIVCSVATYVILTLAGSGSGSGSGLSPADALHFMGYWPVGLREAASALLLTAVLFAGPLFEHFVVEAGWRAYALPFAGSSASPVADLLSDWTKWRNLVAGPVTEEVLFRAAAVPLLLLARTPVAATVLLSPVVFGLAHLHHAYEFSLTNPRVPVTVVALRSLVQFTYTTLFGAYATFVYVRTASLLAVCVVHSFCNAMGLPRFWGRVHRPMPAGGPSSSSFASSSTASTIWTLAYYAILVAGAVSWYQHLWTLTESPLALATFGGK